MTLRNLDCCVQLLTQEAFQYLIIRTVRVLASFFTM